MHFVHKLQIVQLVSGAEIARGNAIVRMRQCVTNSMVHANVWKDTQANDANWNVPSIVMDWTVWRCAVVKTAVRAITYRVNARAQPVSLDRCAMKRAQTANMAVSASRSANVRMAANAIRRAESASVHRVSISIWVRIKACQNWKYLNFLRFPIGWTGDVCANQCQQGSYGINCEQVCECFNGGYCHHITGECECAPGFMGNKCLDSCPGHLFGVNCTQICRCQNGATCNSSNGACSCTPGWKGVDCTRRWCPENVFGETCNKTCECEKENTKICHPWTGKCDCKAGWSSTLCNRPCPFLTYGENCNDQCDCKNGAQCSPIKGNNC